MIRDKTWDCTSVFAGDGFCVFVQWCFAGLGGVSGFFVDDTSEEDGMGFCPWRNFLLEDIFGNERIYFIRIMPEDFYKTIVK